MAIQTARVQINGTWHTLTKNSSTGKWEATITAPSVTSYNLAGHYYPVTVEATNQAGTKTTVSDTDPAIGNSLKLVVKEKIKPTVTIISPGNGAYVSNNKMPVVVQLRDETNGSGVNLSTLSIKIDGTAYSYNAAEISSTAVTGGYDVTFTPSSPLADGPHTVSMTVKDNDENTSVEASVTYTVDTVPPVLNITSPTDGLITATAALTISGTTNDITSSPVTVKVLLNNTDQGAVTVADNGAFTKSVTLIEGENTIKVTSTDLAGKSSSVTVTVLLDTSVPDITDVSIAPNPADAGETLIISVTIS